jgi:hypothetical protein
MPELTPIIIRGYHVKELRCKNDNCRALLGWENIGLGVLVHKCNKCGEYSIFNVQYRSMAKPLIDKLQKKFGEGGETK